MRERLADRPPRPLADAPIGPLLSAADELTRDWLIEVVAQIPLADVPTLEVAPLAADGPEVCRAVVAAIATEDALAELRAGGRLAPLLQRVLLAAARGRAAEVPAVAESLRRVVWSAAQAQLDARPSGELVASLSDRIAHVAATIAATAIGVAPADADAGDRTVVDASASAPTARDARHDIPSEAGGGLLASDPTEAADAASPSADPLEFIVRDVRARTTGTPLHRDWVDELRDALVAESARSLLLADLDGHERILAADGRAALQRAERALTRNLVDDATMVAERLGRYWVVCGCSGADDAAAFGHRLADAVAAEPGHRGTSLRASIGFTLLDAAGTGEGDDPLLEPSDRAEEAMLSARAAGAGVDSR